MHNVGERRAFSPMAGNNQSDAGRGLTLGLELAAAVGLGAFAGNWIDHKYHSSPWGVLIGAGLGFASGMYLMIKEALRPDKK
jgi:F0F1-type ATP synthase assembly protein I